MKKADLSMNMIIVAVIALIVLIIVVAIFAGKMTGWRSGVKSTEGEFRDNCLLPGTDNFCAASPQECEAKGAQARRASGQDGNWKCGALGAPQPVCCFQ